MQIKNTVKVIERALTVFFYVIIVLYKRKGNKKYEETKANDSESLVNIGVS